MRLSLACHEFPHTVPPRRFRQETFDARRDCRLNFPIHVYFHVYRQMRPCRLCNPATPHDFPLEWHFYSNPSNVFPNLVKWTA